VPRSYSGACYPTREALRLEKLEKRARIHVAYAKKVLTEGKTPAKDLRERLDNII
jgi:hypothetical protein